MSDDLRPDDARSMRWPLAFGVLVLVALVAYFWTEVRGQWARVEAGLPTARAATRAPAVAPAASVVTPKPPAVSVAWCATDVYLGDERGERMRAALPTPMHEAFFSARSRLGVSASLRFQALGHHAGWGQAEAERRVRLGRAPHCTERECAPEQRMVAGMAREELARLAAPGKDPLIYALAYEACDALGPKATERGSCQLITAEQWARIDPHNAMPWLAMASHAQLRDDSDAVREALYRLATAKRSESHRGAFSRAVLAHAPADPREIEHTAWAAMLAGVEVARRPPPVGTIDLQCAQAAVVDANRRQVCDQIATLFYERADTLQMRQFGLELGRRVGWPASAVAAGEQTTQALLQMQKTHAPELEALTCPGAQLLNRFVRRQAVVGELGALKEMLAASPAGEAELARRYRDESVPKEIVAAGR